MRYENKKPIFNSVFISALCAMRYDNMQYEHFDCTLYFKV